MFLGVTVDADACSALTAFLSAGCCGHPALADGDGARLRAAIRTLADALDAAEPPDPAALALLNEVVAREGPRPALAVDGERRLRLQRGAGSALGALAHAAAQILGGAAAGRLRRCAGCACMFHDGSRNRSRTWCSMARCGNRAKIAAFRRRRGDRRA